jgi:hypothetical protein
MAAQCPVVGGTLIFRIDGRQYRTLGEVRISPSGVERETVVGLDGVHGYKEKPRAPYISAKLSDWADLSIETLIRACNVTVTVELANGKVYLLRNAWVAEPPEGDMDEGSWPLRLEGLRCEELPAQAA